MVSLTFTPDLAAIRAEACVHIDAVAEVTRSKYITLGSGQAMVYQEKAREAEAISANPSISDAEVPHLSKEANDDGVSLLDKAIEVLTISYQWSIVSSYIEETRLQTKKLINSSTSLTQIKELRETSIDPPF